MGAGYLININDIAGPYSGIIFGISNTMSTLTGILSPYLASNITKHVIFCFFKYFNKNKLMIVIIIIRDIKVNGKKCLL